MPDPLLEIERERAALDEQVRAFNEAEAAKPNRAERAIADFIEDKPTLQAILRTVGRPLSAAANVAESGVNLVRGRPGEALEGLKRAGGEVVDLAGDLVEGAGQTLDAVLPGDVIPSNFIPDVTTPEDFRSFANVLETAGVPRGPVFDLPVIGKVSARGLGGFGLDVALDPLNLGAKPIARVTTPPVKAAGKFLMTKTPLRHLATGSEFTREASSRALGVGGAAGRKAQQAIDDVWASAQKAAKEAGLDLDTTTSRFLEAVERKGELPSEAAPRRAAVKEIKRRMRQYQSEGYNPREAARAAYIATTTGDELMAPFAGQTQAILRDILLTEQKMGVNVGALSDPGLNYLSRVLTPEAWEAMKAAGKLDRAAEFANNWTARQGFTKARKIHSGKMIPEINDFIRKELGDNFRYELFSEDPARIAAIRGRQHGRALRASEFYRSIVDDFAVDATPEQAIAGAIPVDDLLRSRNLVPGEGPFAGSSGKVLPREIANAVLQTFDAWNNPATPKGLLGIMVRATDHFKSWVTAPFPAFHYRNWVSNMWANYLAGVKNPRRYIDAIEMARDMGRGGAKVWEKYGGLTSKQILETMGDSHALGFGATSAEEFASIAGSKAAGVVTEGGHGLRTGTIVKAADRENFGRVVSVSGNKARVFFKSPEGQTATVVLPVSALSPVRGVGLRGRAGVALRETAGRIREQPIRGTLSSPGLIVRAGRAVGELIEDNAKIAHVLDRLRKGDSLDHAILSAKKYLFDYGELSPIEKRLFRRIVPFYTFTRKNTPLQLEALFTKPGKIANLHHFQRMIQARDTGDEGVDTSIIPQWVRRRLFGAERLDDGSMRVLSGLGIGFEELSMLDRPFEEFVSMLNPLIKGPLQLATNHDYFRDVPLDRADIAPSILQMFEYVPGGKVFLDAIDFRPVKERSGEVRFYRANPRFLNAAFGTLIPGTSRAAQAASQLIDLMNPDVAIPEGRPEPGMRFVTGFRRSTMSPVRQMQENQRRMLEQYVKRLEQLQREGVTFEIEDKFAIRRDIGVEDPRRREAREINRAIGKAQKALRRLSRTSQTGLLREGLRSGGQ